MFQLDSIPVGVCGSFSILTFLDCDAALGLTFYIYPDSLCLPSSNWSGASIELDAVCYNGEVIFTFENIGSASTTQAIQYFVVEDDVILLQGTVEQLLMGEKKSLFYL